MKGLRGCELRATESGWSYGLIIIWKVLLILRDTRPPLLNMVSKHKGGKFSGSMQTLNQTNTWLLNTYSMHLFIFEAMVCDPAVLLTGVESARYVSQPRPILGKCSVRPAGMRTSFKLRTSLWNVLLESKLWAGHFPPLFPRILAGLSVLLSAELIVWAET